MLKLGIRYVRRAVSGAGLTDFGKVACASLLLVLSCVLSPAFAQASEVVCPVGSQVMTGSGTESTPYQVTNICQLQGISSRPAAYYVLMDNIDASTTKDWNGGKGFRPIASTAAGGFSGSFVNSDDYVISSLTISRSSTDNVGLFSRLAKNGKIEGIMLAGSRTTGRFRVGSLVGENKGVIEDCTATGFVSGVSQHVGGLAGLNGGNINNSFATGFVSGKDYVGGLAGSVSNSGSVNNSSATGSVLGTGVGTGGLAGSAEGGNSGSATINNSHAASTVTGASNVGGLMGQGFAKSISNSYATGSVFGTGNNIGGLVGRLHFGLVVSNSYAAGSVSGSDNVGGLVGLRGSGDIINSYYAAAGRNNGSGIKRSFAQLRCPTTASATCLLDSQEGALTYNGWDTDVWGFDTAMDLPQLLSNRNPGLNRKPYIKGSTELVGEASTGITRFPLEADYPGLPGEPATLTWSLSFDASSVLSGFVYFVRGDSTTSTEFIDRKESIRSASRVTLVIVGDERLVGESFDVELRNSIFDNIEQLPVSVGWARPSVDGGTVQTRMMLDASPSTILGFSATDPDNPDSGGAGLEWSFFSTDRVAEGSTVEFSGTTRGGTVEVVVTRNSLGAVGSFVLEVKSPVGLKTMVTVTIETVCSTEPGADLMAGLVGEGTPGDRYQIERLCQLQDIGSRSTAHYVLADDIDASVTKDWNDGAGFEPIASFSGSFVNTGNYEIRSLTISRSGADYAGLFSRLAENATIRGVTLVGSSVIGGNNVGSLAGSNAGVIEGCSVTGTVSGGNRVGGLVGESSGDIINSYAVSTVTGTTTRIGGLVGFSSGDISGSFATGPVSGETRVGGLTGFSGGDISGSSATGSVSGVNQVGGLVGFSEGSIRNSHAAGAVTGNGFVGGLVGDSRGTISGSYATGSVAGAEDIGGLVGRNNFNSSISDSYATGSVFGLEYVGGLVGQGDVASTISNSYATGFVYGAENVGGLAGGDLSTIRNSYYAARGRNNRLGEERSFAQLRCPTTVSRICPPDSQETYKDWDSSVWYFGSATDLPQLSSNQNLDLNRKPYIKSSTELVVGTGFPGTTRFSLEADYPGTLGESVILTWSLSTLSDFVYFELADRTTSTEANGSAATLAVVRDDLMEGKGFYVVLKNNISANGDRVLVRTEKAKQPYISREKAIDPVRVGSTSTFDFSVGYAGTPGTTVTLTWSISDVPASLLDLVYFDLRDGTTSRMFTDKEKFTDSASPVTLVVADDERLAELAGKGFYVVLKNNISDDVDRVQVQIDGASPFVIGGREQIGTIWERSTNTILSFRAIDQDSPDSGGAGLSWSFLSTDIAEGSAVEFGGTTRGGTVEVVVTRNSYGAVGSFVLEVKSSVGVKTMVTVTIETVCSTEPGADLMAGLVGEGTPGDRYQIERLCQLQDIGSRSTAHYVLADDIDASVTKDWNDGAGFEPIASFSGSFVNTGNYEIRSLTISRSGADYAGLFSRLAENATIRGVTLVGSSVIGGNNVGSLAGSNAGVIEGCSVTGTVSGGNRVGGLVGESSGDIINSYAVSTVTGTTTRIGGLVGFSSGDISGSFATGSVSGETRVGGLTGESSGDISGSSATGSVSGVNQVGGLVGFSSGDISGSFATGSVSGGNRVGGLTGESSGDISGSSATGSVSGVNRVGGLVGFSEGSIRNSHAAGAVTGNGFVGGLAGDSRGAISASYATGSVDGAEDIGGLVGRNNFNSSIRDSYATGSVFGLEYVGGLVGQGDVASTISNSYATGFVYGAENVGGLAGGDLSTIRNSYYAARGRNNRLGEERSFAQLRCPTKVSRICPPDSQETYKDWDSSVWYFGSATDLPQLSSNQNLDLNRKPYIKSSTELVVGTGFPGTTRFSLEADYPGSPGESVVLTWSLSTLSDFVYFELADRTTSTEANGSAATLAVVRDDLMEGKGFYVVLKNNISANGDRVLVRTEKAKHPYISREKAIDPVKVGNTSTFDFSVGYAGTPGTTVTLTWSLSGVPDSLRDFVYFDLRDGTTSRMFTDRAKFTDSASPVTLVVVGDERLDELAGKGFYVVLKNNISDDVDLLQVRIAGAIPFVIGGREQIGTIWERSTNTILSFRAIDQDSPDSGGAGLSWSFLSTDIAEGLTVEFSGTTRGGAVEVEVTRPLDLYDVGSFVLEVTSPASAKTTLAVTIETVCFMEQGEDLMAGQTGTGTPGNPYRIERLCQLQDVRSNLSAYYELAADIDGNRARMLNGGAGFEPISIFSGSFVSTRNYEIRSLTISRSDTDNVGLFSRLAKGATIRGIILVGSRTTGRNNVGSLAGSNAGVIVDCSATGSVFGIEQVGGLVGRNEEDASVSRSYAASTVRGTDYVGGLVGFSRGDITDGYARGSVFGSGDNIGGLVGYLDASIRNTYAFSTVTGTTTRIGGLVGFSVREDSIVSSYYTGQENGLGERRTYRQLACPTAPDAMCSLSTGLVTYAGWSSRIWDFDTDDGLPQLRPAIGDLTAIPLRVRVYLGGAVR